MSKVVVVTDSSATIPDELVRELGILVVPIVLNLGGRSYRDGVDLSPDDFYSQLRSADGTPTTSTPSAGEFSQVYRDAARGATGIVSIHVSAQLSSIHDTAVLASRSLAGTPIRVVDSRSAAMAHGFVVLEAARAAAQGEPMDAVVARARHLVPKVHLFAFLDTLQFLRRGGRLGGTAWLLGSALQIKPAIRLVEGRIEPFGRPRTRHKATERILEAAVLQAAGRPVHAAVMHADAPNEARELRDRLANRLHCEELYLTEFTPVMGAHTGPGLLGIALYAEGPDRL